MEILNTFYQYILFLIMVYFVMIISFSSYRILQVYLIGHSQYWANAITNAFKYKKTFSICSYNVEIGHTDDESNEFLSLAKDSPSTLYKQYFKNIFYCLCALVVYFISISI